MKKLFLALAIISLCVSCNSYKKISYVRGVGERVDLTQDAVYLSSGVPDPVFKVGDVLSIIVNANGGSADEVVVVSPFNLQRPGASGTWTADGGWLTYLIDLDGNLIFPTLGKIPAAGMTKSELNKYLVKELSKYLKDEPIVTIRYANFKITVIKEEGTSSNHYVDGDKISIFEGLAMAGGLSLHARRDNVLLIRETTEGRKTYRIDLRDENLLTSPYYWLQQSDVLYIHADKQSARSTHFGIVENMALSLIGTAMSITNFTISLMTYLKTK